MPAWSFRIKLWCAMLGVVAGVTLAALYITQRRVETTYGRLFETQFAGQTQLLSALRETRLRAIKTTCADLGRSVRLQAFVRRYNASRERGDLADLAEVPARVYQTATNELRYLRDDSSAGPGASRAAFLRLLDAQGRLIPPPPEVEVGSLDDALSRAVETVAGAALPGEHRGAQAVGHLAQDAAGGRRLFEVVLTRLLDTRDGSPLGALVIGALAPEGHAATEGAPDPEAVVGAVAGVTGFFVGGELFAAPLEGEVRRALAERLAMVLGPGPEAGDVDVELKGGSHRAFFVRLDRGSPFPAAYQVSLFSLAPMRAEREALRARIAALGAVAMLVGLAVSALLAHGLSVPIRELVAGAGEVQRGNYAVRVPVRRRDELGRLAGAFNAMTEGLVQKEKLRSVLNLVADRAVAEELTRGQVALGGEAREVSVLFCDIRGFTALTQDMAPAEVVRLLNEHFTPLTRIVYAHHGVVDKFVGDLIMAVFGAPRSYGNDALNAVNCAREMLAARAALNHTSSYRIDVGIGLASGPALAGCMGSIDRLNYTVLGERVNLASRLCSQAGRMEIVLDRTTHERAGDGLAAELLPPLRLKGFSAPVLAYRLKGASPPGDPAPVPERARATPAVGAAAAMPVALLLLGGVAVPGALRAADPLQRLDDALKLESRTGAWRADLSGLLDLEAYYIDGRAPGLLFGDTDFFNPRLSLYLDTRVGRHIYSFVQARFDRGFDPRATGPAARADEYLLRYTPFDDARVNLQVGKFATVFGRWVPRHDAWQNPLITAPVPYENVVTVTDQTVPPSLAGFLGRRDKPDAKAAWLPVVWGPSYTAGGAVFGAAGRWDYAVEVKNASLSSRPSAWDPFDLGWEHPTVSGRVGHRPNAAWELGASFSFGPYLLPVARAALPPGLGLADFHQIVLGHDVRFAWRHWQAHAEVVASRFEVPKVGAADTLAWFFELKYKLAPRWFAAARWNQQFFADVPDGAAGRTPWDRDLWRADVGLGYRLTRHLQAKAQYSYSQARSPLQQGEQLVAGQFTVKF